jgi:acyl-CoA thioester hydrolase
MTHPQLAGFPVVVAMDVAWGEMDSYAHVNNVVYFRYFENARLDYLSRVGWLDLMRDTGVGPILHSTHARFRKALSYPDRILVGARVITIEPDRVTFEHRLVSGKWDDLAAAGQSVIVCYDYRGNRKAAIPDHIRERIDRLEQGGK